MRWRNGVPYGSKSNLFFLLGDAMHKHGLFRRAVAGSLVGCLSRSCVIIIIIIIIKNVKIRVTLSWITLQGHFTELLK